MTLDPILTGMTGEDLKNYINDLLPKFVGVPQEEEEFLRRERELKEKGAVQTLEGAERAAQRDITALQPGLGGAMTPTTGGGMRGQIGATAGIRKGFEGVQEELGAAKDVYGLTMDKAALAEEKGLYGLTTAAEEAYESDILGSFGGLDSPFAKPGGTHVVDPDFWRAEEGGRVPTKGETFLDFLTQLPDAGGT
jgi:hypothetical protein